MLKLKLFVYLMLLSCLLIGQQSQIYSSTNNTKNDFETSEAIYCDIILPNALNKSGNDYGHVVYDIIIDIKTEKRIGVNIKMLRIFSYDGEITVNHIFTSMFSVKSKEKYPEDVREYYDRLIESANNCKIDISKTRMFSSPNPFATLSIVSISRPLQYEYN